MKKNFLLFLLLSFYLFPINLISPVLAQGTSSPAQPDQHWRPLIPRMSASWNVAELTGKGFPVDFDIFIVDCQNTAKGTACTTYNPQSDNLLSLGGADQMQIRILGPNPLKTTNGEVKVRISATIADGSPHVFFGVTVNELKLLGNSSTLKLGTFEPDPPPQSISFLAPRGDPFGRIFDSQSLEPIPDIEIRLLDQLNPEHLADIMKSSKNIIKVGPDGYYNFLVTEGTYYLRLNGVPSTHRFTATPNLHPNYVKAYSKEDGTSSIYRPDEEIIEKVGQPEQRDIPLDPGSNPPYRGEIKVINYGQVSLGNTQLQTKYSGKISHPLSMVTLAEAGNEKNEIAKTTADKFGFWEIILDDQKIPQDKALALIATKVDLTLGQSTSIRNNKSLFASVLERLSRLIQDWSKKAEAVTEKPLFEPIRRSVSGYALDASGKVIPNAQIKVKLQMSNRVYYQTTADENGYFQISTDHLPRFEYDLEITPPNKSTPILLSTSEFTRKNNLYAGKIPSTSPTGKIQVTPGEEKPTPKKPFDSKPTESGDSLPSEPPSNPDQTSKNQLVFLVTFVLLIGIAVVGVYLYRRKKAQNPPLPPVNQPQ